MSVAIPLSFHSPLTFGTVKLCGVSVPTAFLSAADKQDNGSSQLNARRREEAKRQLISAVDIIQEVRDAQLRFAPAAR